MIRPSFSHLISQWRERQALQIQRRDEESARRKEETVQKARQAIDDFYENYNSKRDRAIEQIRQDQNDYLSSRDETLSGGTTWERIVKLVDTNDKTASKNGRDTNRMRELLLSLRKDQRAPGV